MKRILFLSWLSVLMQITALVPVAMAQKDGGTGGIRFIKNAKSWQDVLTQSEVEGKPIFVDVYTDWCEPCKWMDKHVFNKEEVGELMNQEFINVKVNAEKRWGANFARQYLVQAYPTFLFLDSKGEILLISKGSKPAGRFLNEARKALKNSEN